MLNLLIKSMYCEIQTLSEIKQKLIFFFQKTNVNDDLLTLWKSWQNMNINEEVIAHPI